MGDTTMALGVTVLKGSIPDGGPLEDQLLAAMRAAHREVWWTVDEEERFRYAVGAVMSHHGPESEEWERLAHEIKGLRLLAAGLEVGSLDALMGHMDEDAPEPVGLRKLWNESKDDQ